MNSLSELHTRLLRGMTYLVTSYALLDVLVEAFTFMWVLKNFVW